MIFLAAWFILLASTFVILRILVPRDYRNRGELSWPIAFLQSLLFILYGGFPIIYLQADWPAVSISTPVLVVGLIMLFGGLAFLLYGLIRLGLGRSIGRGSAQLQMSNIYSCSRNPQAIACALYVIGFILLWPSWQALGWALLYPLLIHMMVLAEEEHLSRQHGQAYEHYCEQIPRYLGSNFFRARFTS